MPHRTRPRLPRSRLLGRLGRFSWSVHNLLAHPLSELLFLVGLERAARWVHDATIPYEPRRPVYCQEHAPKGLR